MKAWWADTLEEDLSQGDIVEELYISRPVVPRVRLVKQTGKRGVETWAPADNWKPSRDGHAYALARGRFGPAVVVSHSCDLDKASEHRDEASIRRELVLVAPVRLLSGISDPEDREHIASQGDYHAMGLLGVPGLGDAYADLRQIMTFERGELEDATRLASMTPVGVLQLQARLAVFFLRADPSFWLEGDANGSRE